MSMPSFFSGRSMMWPTVARTRYARPRYLPIVFAFAGDSTITSDVDPDSGPAPFSSTSTDADFRARAGAAVFAARLVAVFFLAVLAFAILMHRYVVAASGRI